MPGQPYGRVATIDLDGPAVLVTFLVLIWILPAEGSGQTYWTTRGQARPNKTPDSTTSAVVMMLKPWTVSSVLLLGLPLVGCFAEALRKA